MADMQIMLPGRPAPVPKPLLSNPLPGSSVPGSSAPGSSVPGPVLPGKTLSSNIGVMIRELRLERGLSQGDIEKRTGLLRCYLSRVENGHTVPSLETLKKIAGALDLQLSQFFAEDPVGRDASALKLSQEEIRFLTQVQRYAANLSDSDRRLLLAMVRKFASSATS